MFRKKKKNEKISKTKLLKKIRAKATLLGDLARDKAHSSKAILIEDLEQILKEIK